jgi:glycosyltransferase involved in cell wall biosynthesis
LVEHDVVDATVVLREDGPLAPDLAAVAPTVRVPRALGRAASSLRARGAGPVADRLQGVELRRAVGDVGDYDLVFANTLTNGALLAAMGPRRPPVLTHAHEMHAWLAQHLPPDLLAAGIAATSRFVAASDPVAADLRRHHEVLADRIEVVHSFVDASRVAGPPGAEERAVWRTRLGLPLDRVVVGAAGTLDWRKGADLFALLAVRLARVRPDLPVHLCWVGGGGARDRARLLHDLEVAGVADRVTLAGERADAPACFAAFDVLALTSREDPFPLVVLENALHGTPTVCFERAGGIPDLVGDDAGVAVPYLDVDAFADAVQELVVDDRTRRRLGERAAEVVRSRHDLETAAPRIAELIRQVAGP